MQSLLSFVATFTQIHMNHDYVLLMMLKQSIIALNKWSRKRKNFL